MCIRDRLSIIVILLYLCPEALRLDSIDGDFTIAVENCVLRMIHHPSKSVYDAEAVSYTHLDVYKRQLL